MNQATTFLHSRSNFERLFFYLLSRIWPHFLGCNIKRHKQTNFAGNRVVRGKRELLYGTLLSKLNWISSRSQGTSSKSCELLQEDIFFKGHRINPIQFRSAYQLHPSLGLFLAHPHYCFYHHQHHIINIVIKPLAGEGDNAGLCAHILTAFSFFLFLVTVPLSLCMCVKVQLDFNLKIFGGCSYGTLWGRENCSILRRRNKLIKSRTDHKRTAKWQPVWLVW